MGRITKWFLMLSKRLYKKPSFLVILLAIPLCVGLFVWAAQQDSGFVHIVLAQEARDDVLSTQLIEKLLAEDSMVRFSRAESPEAAVKAVQMGQADEAWVFPSDTEVRIRDFVTGKEEYIVQAVVREDTSLLQLSREKLPSVIYGYCAKAHYIGYVRKHFSQLDGLTEGELAAYFDQVQVSEELFLYGDPADPSVEAGAVNYLTSPIRGLLAVLMLLCTMAATLFYMQDEDTGTFCWVRPCRKGLTALGCVMTAGVNVSVVVLVALVVSGLGGNVCAEIGALLIYCLCCSSFCLLLKTVFSSIRLYGALIPLATVVVTGLCPVFVDFRKWQALQLIFPPTYYINSSYDGVYFLYGIVYAFLCLGLAWLISRLRKALPKRVV